MSSLKRKSDVGSADASKKAKTNGSIMSFFGAPKAAPSSSPSRPAAATGSTSASAVDSSNPASKFDKAAWVSKLTSEQKKYLALEINTLDRSWLAVLKDEIVKPEFIALKKFIEAEIKSGQTVFPPSEDVYAWSRYTPFHTVKCVILGQDPYHNHNQAHGLCFSVRPPTPAPPSLKNMYIALKKDYPSFAPPPAKNGGLLTPWAENGVLMLNTCLTVRAHQAGSHQRRGWEALTQRAIDAVAQKRTRGVVFLAWGKPAGDRVAKVDARRHLVLRSAHPSPLSASRGFFDCGHFRKANDWLAERYGPEGEINWNLDPEAPPTTSLAGKGDAADDDGEDAVREAEGKGKEVTPVVAVGEVDDGVEESEILEKQGEEGKETS
ncbi:putative uracil-DNA glycosylase [Rosellinia necatrix]|uniref:Uracil-DNA glycosylase n=1 Tax=Rosellinia necatrix TaxID=77044 RepID=A0A1W2TKE7_ROSNE|nr:putative uracil-DNA glycosylase [Rosellinia necatrix]